MVSMLSNCMQHGVLNMARLAFNVVSSILSFLLFALHESIPQGVEDKLDGKSMGDTWRIYGGIPKPGCQRS